MAKPITIKITGDSKGLDKALGSAGKSLGKFGKAAGAGLVAVGAVGAGVAAGLYKIGETFDTAMDTIAVGTGATGEALAGLEDDFKEVFSNVPGDADQVAGAISNLNTLMGVTGDELTGVATQVLEASRMLGEDGVANTESFSRSLAVFGVDSADAAGAADMFFVASQKYGVGFDAITANVQKFGPVLNNAGFSIEETTDLFGQMNAAGIDLTRVMPGLNAATRKWADEGLNAKDMLGETIEAMAGASTNAEALSIATEAFGAEGAQRMVTAAREGAISIDELGVALENTDGAIANTASETDSFGEKFGRFKNKMMVLIEPLASKIFDGLGRVFERVAPYIEGFIGWLQAKWPLVQSVIQAGTEKVQEVLEALEPVWAAVQTAAMAVYNWFVDNWDEIRETVETVFDAVVGAGQTVVDFFADNWDDISAAIEGAFEWIVDNKDMLIGAIVAVSAAYLLSLVPAMVAATVAAGAAAVAFIAANAPIVAIALVIAALGAAVVYAYQNFEWFRTAVDAVASFFMDTVLPKLQEFAGWVVEAFGKVVGWVQENWPAIQEVITTVIGGIVDFVMLHVDILVAIFETGWAVISAIWDVAGGTIMAIVGNFVDTVVGVFNGFKEMLLGVFNLIKALLTGKWGEAWDAIKQIVSGAIGIVAAHVRGILSSIGEILGGLFALVTNPFKRAFNAALNFVKGFPTKMKDAAKAVGSAIADGIGDGLSAVGGLASDFASAVVGAVKSGWNTIAGQINAFVPNQLGWGRFSLDLPDNPIPTFATGGTSRGGMAIVGERGPERVMLPRGARVIPNHAIGGDGTGGVTVNVSTNANPYEIGREVAWTLKTAGI